ncbi:MAG TPA: sigma-70 family RNA polymerase sigma factor [Oscillatoriaceae cyanobacterium]
MALEEQIDEQALVARLARGDARAMARLYDRYAGVVYSLAWRMLGVREEAEEVVLEVFSQAWNSAARYDKARGRVDSWLLVMARSRSLDRLRGRQRSERIASALEEQAQLHGTPTEADPEAITLIAERRQAVREALDALSPQQRSTLELVYYEGLSHTEVSARTGEPLGTIKTRVRSGLGKLRDALGLGEGMR